MAKIRIDFSKASENPGWNTRPIEPGTYAAEIASCTQKDAKDGTAMLVYGLRPVGQSVRSRLFPYYCKLQPNQLWKLRDLLTAAGEQVPRKALNVDPQKVVGRKIAIEVIDSYWEEKQRSEVDAVYPLDVVEESEDNSAPDTPKGGEGEEVQESLGFDSMDDLDEFDTQDLDD